MGFQRLLDRLRPLMQHLRPCAPEGDAADGVSGFSDGFDARPWLSRFDPSSAQLFCAVIEAGFLIAQADGRFDRAERAHLHRALPRTGPRGRRPRWSGQGARSAHRRSTATVSYTHLTLPTSDLV